MAKSTSPSIIPFSFNGVLIRRDTTGRISLTDLWKAAGRVRSNRPAAWTILPTTLGFIAATERFLKVIKSDLLVAAAGRGGGTYAHLQIALEYAQYLDANLAVAVNQVFIERVEEDQNPDKILDRAEATYRRRGFTEGQIQARFLGKATRSRLVSVLAHHGVRKHGYRLCTNATYEPLWGGTAADIRVRKNLPEKANPREHMSEKELVGLHLAELLAAEGIERVQARGNQQCADECKRAAQSVARMITSHTEGGRPRSSGSPQ